MLDILLTILDAASSNLGFSSSQHTYIIWFTKNLLIIVIYIYKIIQYIFLTEDLLDYLSGNELNVLVYINRSLICNLKMFSC